MNTNNRFKMQDSLNIIQNNNTATLALCTNGMPYITNITYDTDCFCNCIKLYFQTCKCGDTIDIIRRNNNATILIKGNRNWCNNNTCVLLEGNINILEPELDCCCNLEDTCCIELEFIPTNIVGKKCNDCCQ